MENQLVIGIDLGTSDSYVAYVGKGTIDIVQNEVSQRRTPTLVGFTDRERLLGDGALSQIKSNTKNTCRNFKHLLAQKPDSAGAEAEAFWATARLEEDRDGGLGFGVNYKGEQAVFSAVEVTAMFLTKLKDITEAWCQGKVADVVVGVPSYYTDFQRTAVLDAARIAGLNVLRVMNEHTATALEYGYFRTNNFDPDKPTTVAFCQMGHAVFSVSIVQFVRGKLSVLCEKSEKVGGRDMDECLVRTFAQQFQKKTGCDVLSNKKAQFKLEDAVTKTKKILSANAESSISCECLMEDEDFGSSISRADFEEMCKPMMKKVSDVLEAAKAACGLPATSIDSVEICGGASRVPWFKEMCSKAFGGKELSTTMNADECVARGCALQAALLSPLYKVREFKVEDTMPFPISLGWTSPFPVASDGDQPGPGERSAVVFPGNSLMNLLKVLTFFRKEPFELKAMYSDEKGLHPGSPTELGSYTIELPAQLQEKQVKVRAALTLHGTFAIQGAQVVEEEREEAPEANGGPGGEEGHGAAERRPEEEKGRRRKLRRTDLAVSASGRPGLAPGEVEQRRRAEEAMVAETREIEETNARRNDLESYILNMRSSVAEGGKYGAYIKEADRAALSEQLERAEDWLYDHLDEGKQVFIGKLAELRVLGDPAERRFKEEARRPELISGLEEAAASFKATAVKPGAKHKNVDKDRLKSLERACEDALAWLADMKPRQAKVLKSDDPVLDCASIEARSEELSRLADAVLEGRGDLASDHGLLMSPLMSPDVHEEEQGDKRGDADARPTAMDVD
mmetsp:Transcript_79931/g.226103  ORF Transcript_79931/g.226103 Transcript_79931/m.226103 type:complete len:795 (+) Transcript_79931:59-2443(+)